MTWKNAAFIETLKQPILVVGAGGIGCELLKNLVLSGFTKIHVIDLDTIDISNLNRQFLFRKEHVGKSKAEVASAAVKSMNPEIDITFDHGSIISDKYDISFFKKFTLVFNALDNLAARAHVNRLCLNADVPLFESGSAGYKGNVFPIIKGKTECFECLEKPKQTTFPGCTIRNTPSEHIHCVVWAKAVFNQLFGEADADDEVSPDESRISENEGRSTEKNGNSENGNSNGTGSTLGKSVRVIAAESNYDPATIFNKLFSKDILYLLTLESLWKDRRRPIPMTWEGNSAAGANEVNKVYPVQTWEGMFSETVQTLGKTFKEAEKDGNVLFWDKDDEVGMNFVAAVANIRAHIFHIPMKPIFEIKSMAGNIIPAIATTNAMVAGMVVVEAIRMLRSGKITDLRTVYTSNKTIAGRLVSSSAANPPNLSCFVCSGDNRPVQIALNINLMKLITFKNQVLKKGLNVVEPDVSDVVDFKLYISADDDVDPDLVVGKVGIKNGALLKCEDVIQDFSFNISILHNDQLDEQQYEIKTPRGTEESMEVDLKTRKRTLQSEEDEEAFVAITPLQLDPAHAEEILALAKEIPSFRQEENKNLDGIHIPRFRNLVELYHDDPALLDKILIELIETLISHIHIPEDEEEKVLNHSSLVSLIFLKLVTTVRGYKTVIRFLPHEVFLLPKLLNLLESYSTKSNFNELESEGIKMILIWFMIVCRNPFDFHTFSSDGEISYPVRITTCLMKIRKEFGKFACLTLAETLTRHEDNSELLDPAIDGCLERLKSPETKVDFSLQISDLQLLSSMFKKGKRNELSKYGNRILDELEDYLGLNSENTSARLQTVKLVQRIGLIYLKPKPASWRYKCGVRSLEENLKISGIETGKEIEKEEDEEIISLDDGTLKMVEKVLNCLLNGTLDKENSVRSSSAKGIGRIAARLPKKEADELISKIFEKNFVYGAAAGNWHGGGMAIAELSQRGCILPERLPIVMDLISKALIFEDDARATAVNVRDAACYICWAFARGFEPKLIVSFLEKLASNLIVTALFDRSVNVRRAASAAFQENVGRNKGFPHGIVLNTLVDYQAVTRLEYCYESLCLEVAEYKEYVIPMLDSLAEVSVTHFQEKIRFLAANSLRLLTKFNPNHVVEVLIPKLMKKTESPIINEKQGSLLALGGLIRGLHECGSLGTLDIGEIQKLKNLIPILAKNYNSALTVGSQLILRAVAVVIESLAVTKMDINDEELLEWQTISDRIASDLNPETRENGQQAVKNLMWYFSENEKRMRLFENVLKNYFLTLKSTVYEHERIGAATGLGFIPATILNEKLNGKIIWEEVIENLIRMIEEENFHRWVYARSAGIKSISRILAEADLDEAKKSRILGCLFVAVRDNTKTIHGLVGQHVRMASMEALAELLPVFEAKKILKPEELGKGIYLIVEQCCERIDGLREFAAETVKTLLEKEDLKGIPDKDQLRSVFGKEGIKWRIDGFAPLTPLLSSRNYRPPVILGLMRSIGGESSWWIQNLGVDQLQIHFRKFPEESNEFFELILQQLNEAPNKGEMLSPVRAFGRLFGEGCFYNVEKNPDNYPLLLEIIEKLKSLAYCGPVNVKKAAMEAMHYIFQCDIKSKAFKKAAEVLTTMLNSKMSAMRQVAAMFLQHAVISLDITNDVPMDELEPILQLLLTYVWRDETNDFAEMAVKYREATPGRILEEIVFCYVRNGIISPELGKLILRKYDYSILDHLRKLKSKPVIITGGVLKTYRFYNNVWTILLKDVSIHQNFRIPVGAVKIVACSALPN
ncbi:hypothetical protein FO519_002685 [Halicephalobus sp. NKZ332]|nr:hypothetical protein FO519_002685 [Halicephalobus sp. NKZ332]